MLPIDQKWHSFGVYPKLQKRDGLPHETAKDEQCQGQAKDLPMSETKGPRFSGLGRVVGFTSLGICGVGSGGLGVGGTGS